MENKVNNDVQQDKETVETNDMDSVLDLQKLDDVAGGLMQECNPASGLSECLTLC